MTPIVDKPRRTACQECEEPIKRHQVRTRYTARAYALFLVAGVVTIVWGVGLSMYAWKTGFSLPLGPIWRVVTLVIYLAPGLLIGWAAASRPRVTIRRCRCGWEGRS